MNRRLLSMALPFSAALALIAACSDEDPKNTGSGGSAGASNTAGSAGKSAGGGGKGGSSGSSGGTAGGTGGGTPATDAFWTSFAEALCHRYFYCIDDADQDARARLRAEAGSADRCTDLLLNNVILRQSRVGALNRGVAAGVLEIQQDWAARCLDAAAICNYPFDDPAAGEITLDDIRPCREVFEGTVGAGGDCHLSEECTGDSMCIVNDAPGACSGTCGPRLAEGETCTVDRQCGSAPAEWPGCPSQECVAYQVGTPSGAGMGCLVTSNQELCADDLWCAAGSCAVPVALDEACDPTSTYESVCLDGRCSDGQCTAFVVRTAAGETCDGDGTVCDSFGSLACVGGECVDADGADGSPCTEDYWFERALCEAPALLADGADCTEGAECASGICAPTGCAATLCSAP